METTDIPKDPSQPIVIPEEKSEAPGDIVIPEGKFEAPGDYELIQKSVVIDGVEYSLRFIKQTYAGVNSQTGELEGNCAEYAALNAAIIMLIADFNVNKDITELLRRGVAPGRQLNLDNIEDHFILPLLKLAHIELKGIKISDESKKNLEDKRNNPYEALTIENAVLLFRYMLSNKPKDFVVSSDIVTLENIDTHFDSRKFGVFMVGKPNHAVALVANGDEYFIVDTYTQGVVIPTTAAQAKEYLRQTLNLPGSYITFNESEKF